MFLKMSSSSENRKAVTHYKKSSWQSKLSESRGVLVLLSCMFAIAAIIIAFAGIYFAPMLYGHNWLAALFFIACFGSAIGSLLVFAARFIDRKFFASEKESIKAIEDRLIAGDNKLEAADLEKLVSGYLKLNRLEAADYYSKKLLELSKSGTANSAKLSDWLVTTECWIFTESYRKTRSYNFFWLFESRGVLSLSPDRVDFQSRQIQFSCSPSNIVSVELKNHPRWQKPRLMKYINLVIDENGEKHSFNLNPSFSQTDTIFDCNALADLWYHRLEQLRRRIAPGGASSDWYKDYQLETETSRD